MNDEGSVYPIAILIICVCVAGFFLLVGGSILEPFFGFMRDGSMKDFFVFLFPNGIALFILIVLIGTTWMEYQKDKYKGGGMQ